MKSQGQHTAETTFFDHFHQATLIFDNTGKIHATNAEWRDKILQGREKSPDSIRQTFTGESVRILEKAMETVTSTNSIYLAEMEPSIDLLKSSSHKMNLLCNADKSFFFLSLAVADEFSQHQRNLNALVQSLDEIVFEVDEDGYYRNAWIAEDARVFFPKETFLSKNMQELLPYSMANRLMRSLKKALETDATIIEEIASPSDSSIWFRYRFAPIHFDQTQRRSVALSIQNITDLKRFQSRLQQSEELHRLVVTATEDAIWDWNILSNEVTVNHRWTEMVGLETRSSLSGTRTMRYDEISRAIFNEDRKQFELHAHSAKNGGAESGATLRLHGKDGKTVWVLSRGAMLRDEDGKAVRWVGAFTNITELFEAQTELGNEKNRLEFIAAHIPIMLAEFDDTGKQVWANKAFLEKPLWQDFDKSVKALLSVDTGEWTDRTLQDDNLKSWETSWCSTKLPNGHRILIGQDTSERNRRLAANFETSKLVALGEIAGGVAHEINNPLAVVLGQSDILMRGLSKSNQTAEKSEQSLRRIKDAAQRIAKIVLGLRMFARDGSQDPLQDVPIENLLDHLASLLREKTENLGIALTLDHDFEGTFDSKQTQLLQILLHLTQNAIDAVANVKHPRKIGIHASKKNGQIIFSIEDNGCGVPEAIRPKLMQPFFTTKPLGSGMGLGLASSFGLAKQLGGTLLLLESRAGKTIFELSLPSGRSTKNAKKKAA